jgi:hypothetical protein
MDMNKAFKTILAISLSSVILAACGTSADPKGTSPQKDTAATNPQTQQSPQQSPTPKTTNQNGDVTSNGTSSKDGKNNNEAQAATTPVTLAKEKSVALDGNAKKQVKANLYESKNQPLYLYLVDKFKTIDEPTNKDTLVQNANHTVKMKITVLSKDSDLDSLKKEALKEMKKTTRNVKEVNSLRNDKFYQNAIVLQATTSKESRSFYILTIDGTPVEVSITRPKKSTAVLSLVTMMKTIGIKNTAM